MPSLPAKIAKTRCGSCIFSPNSPIGAQRMRELSEAWKSSGGHQICHHFGTGSMPDEFDGDGDPGELDGEDVWCRGFWDTQVPEEVKRIAISAGLVQFIDEPACEDSLA